MHQQEEPVVKLSLSHNFQGPQVNMNEKQKFYKVYLTYPSLCYTVPVEAMILLNFEWQYHEVLQRIGMWSLLAQLKDLCDSAGTLNTATTLHLSSAQCPVSSLAHPHSAFVLPLYSWVRPSLLSIHIKSPHSSLSWWPGPPNPGSTQSESCWGPPVTFKNLSDL